MAVASRRASREPASAFVGSATSSQLPGSSSQKLSIAPIAQIRPFIHQASPVDPRVKPQECSNPVRVGPQARAKLAIEADTPLIRQVHCRFSKSFRKKHHVRNKEVEQGPHSDDEAKRSERPKAARDEREDEKLGDHGIYPLDRQHKADFFRRVAEASTEMERQRRFSMSIRFAEEDRHQLIEGD
ncbi:MAG: hypothetical protein OHK93_006656 [Ramalina farinacea]|uniref:Uncharacterized protein n=1 Tax=Ramalina farinacea TaxID=258253 RepID=A0AA43QKG6_9LECA|nr:hypothetical protein [Ramalina farinacea]